MGRSGKADEKGNGSRDGRRSRDGVGHGHKPPGFRCRT
jgi:hypothetical protein